MRNNSHKVPRTWEAEEKAIVIEMAHMPLATIEAALGKKGYDRNQASIRGFLRRHVEAGKKWLNGMDVAQNEPVLAAGEPKIMYFDIETSDLSAGFGELLCFGYWWHHETRPRVLNIYDYEGWDDLPVERRDKYLLADVAMIMEEADVIIGHYSTKFDFPFIQTRLAIHKMKPIPQPIHIDTWRISKYCLKLNNNKLKTIAEALECDEQKAGVPLMVWRRAKAHDLAALKLISKYNLQDVRTERSIVERLMPLTKSMPSWNVFTNDPAVRCPSCGGTHLIHRGYVHTKLFKFDRLCCADCGKWMRSRTSVTPKDTSRAVG
jgi:uncharacterized protein YprB with RNaseH-like and TPR domain